MTTWTWKTAARCVMHRSSGPGVRVSRSKASTSSSGTQTAATFEAISPASPATATTGAEPQAHQTVRDWIERRFKPRYPGYDAVVFLGDGTRAHGNTRIQNVLATYA
jgi:hypothetical protein